MYNDTIYGLPSNTTFTDVFASESAFLTAYKASKIYTLNSDNRLSDDDAKLLYYLLYGRYGNDSISSRDTERFKYQIWQLMFMYGPAWKAKLDLQKDVRSATLAQLAAGNKSIQNQALNPGGTPSAAELTAINQQNTITNTKSLAEAIAIKADLLESDVTNWFLEKFRPLFAKVAAPVYQIAFPVEADE